MGTNNLQAGDKVVVYAYDQFGLPVELGVARTGISTRGTMQIKTRRRFYDWCYDVRGIGLHLPLRKRHP